MDLSLLSLDSWYWVCAILCTLFFVFRLFISFFLGLDSDLSLEIDSDASFGMFSLTSLTGFGMLFGWGGLTASVQFGLSGGLSLVFALACGCIALVLTAFLGSIVMSLKSKGADFTLEKTIGKNGSVYQQIPANGTGKIQISSSGMLREIEATADEDLETGSLITVTSVLSATTVKVKKAEV